VTWSYDKTYQLRNEQRSGSNSYNITYTYDPVGNRLVLINGGVLTTSTYDAANELRTSHAFSAGITTYTSDAAGNLLNSLSPSNQRTTNIWDFEDRLTQMSLPSAIVDTFTYNGDGQRVQKIDSTGTTNHVWDGQNILFETNASNIIQVVYTLQPMLYGKLISQWRSGTASFYLFDGLGSTTQLVGSTGSVTDSYLYDSFGNILLASGSTTNWFRYVGRFGYYYDLDTAGYFVRARVYYPMLGRFPSHDRSRTSTIACIASSGYNLYLYTRSNPVNFMDASGLDPVSDHRCWMGQQTLCLAACGLWPCFYAGVGAGPARSSSQALTGMPESPQGGDANDAMRHCIWQCFLTKDAGPAGAECVGEVHEACATNFLQQILLGDQSMDLHNNAVGRSCATQGCNCFSCCADALSSGQLITVRPAPPAPIPGPPRYD
jgi:RHS repeat-associated protein